MVGEADDDADADEELLLEPFLGLVGGVCTTPTNALDCMPSPPLRGDTMAAEEDVADGCPTGSSDDECVANKSATEEVADDMTVGDDEDEEPPVSCLPSGNEDRGLEMA